MGEVWKVRDMRLDRTVAIKTSHATKFSERFEREARAVAALNHPHICISFRIYCGAALHYGGSRPIIWWLRRTGHWDIASRAVGRTSRGLLADNRLGKIEAL